MLTDENTVGDDTVPAEPHRDASHTMSGRYHARVMTLTATGEAQAEVVATLARPTDDDFVAVYGADWQKYASPHTCQFIGGLPGELVAVELRWRLPRPGRKRPRRTPAPTVRLLDVIEASPERVEAPCPVFGECGGCQLQHLAYPAQLAWKAQRVRAALAAAGFGEETLTMVAPTLGCDTPWNYRNHMRFSVNREGQVGLTARHSHRVLPLGDCPIAETRINAALAILGETPQPQPQALVRYAVATGEMLLQPSPNDAVRERLAATGLNVKDDAIEEALHGARFRIRPSSFFQTNTRQAERMADLALAALPAGRAVTLVDAYCGVGTFARLMADQAGRVLAIEESASAVRDARANLSDTPQVEIIQAKVEDALPVIGERLDGLIIDPPRAGCQPPVLDALIARRVPVVVYVSCDPDTLARDLAYLCLRHRAYRVRGVQPLDMFPQTAHIENVVTLDAVAQAQEGQA